jgi:spermidine/putrescine-binding protein
MTQPKETIISSHELTAASAGATRRQFLRGSLALATLPVVGGVLAACGGKGSSGGATPLNTILWAGIFDKSLPWFEQQYNITVNNRPQVDPIQSANMVKAQPGEIDLVSFGPFDSPFVYDDLAIPLDMDRIKESWDVQYPYFRTMWDPKVFAPASFGGKVYQVPYQWGSTVLAWNTKRITDPPNSWSVMADPAHKGRTSFNDQAAEMYGTLSIALGRNPNSFAQVDLDATNELADRWFDNAKTLWSTGDDIKQLMAQEEVWVAHIWDGTARQLVKEGYPIDYTYPVEGVRGTVDGPGIMKTAEHIDAAYDFVNFSMSKRFGVEMGENTLYASGNQQVAEALSPQTRQIMRIDEMGKLLDNGKMAFQRLAAEDFAAIDKWWSALKLKHQG